MYQSGPSTLFQTSQSKREKQPVLIDTDIGDDIDDAFALALALRSPEIDLRGVTTVFGDTQLRARLALHLLRDFGREDIPVAVGVGKPLQPRHRRHVPSGVPQAAILNEHPPETHALSTFSGPELIVKTAMEHSEQLILLCIGPLTNIALALLIEPHISSAIRNIIMMGGTSGFPLPEWNVRNDVKAAQMVLSAGIPVTMIGLNVTSRCRLRERDIEQLQKSGMPQAQLLYQLMMIWQRHRPRWHPPLPFLHDPLTVAAFCAPELLHFNDMKVQVIEHGPFRGFMVPRIMGGSPVYTAIDVQVSKTRDWIMQRLLSV